MVYFKSPWFFWYTGHKAIACASMVFSTAMMWLILAASANFSIWAIIIAVLLDSLGLWIALIYLFALRTYIDQLPMFQNFVRNLFDNLVLHHMVVPVLIGFFTSRLASFVIAKLCQYRFKSAS